MKYHITYLDGWKTCSIDVEADTANEAGELVPFPIESCVRVLEREGHMKTGKYVNGRKVK